MARVLSNPFYIGLLRIRKVGETYLGIHKPLIPKAVFDRVQMLLAGKRVRGSGLNSFLFRRLVACKTCSRSLIAEAHKCHVYYRCHTRTCPSTIVREETIDQAARRETKKLQLLPEELETLDEALAERRATYRQNLQAEIDALTLQQKAIIDRQNRLTDAYLEGTLDRSEYEQRKTALLSERCDIEERFTTAKRGDSAALADLEKYVELVKSAYLLYENGLPEEKRELLKQVMSNRTASGKSVEMVLKSAISAVANRPQCPTGGPSRREHLKFWSGLFDQVALYGSNDFGPDNGLVTHLA